MAYVYVGGFAYVGGWIMLDAFLMPLEDLNYGFMFKLKTKTHKLYSSKFDTEKLLSSFKIPLEISFRVVPVCRTH